MKKFLYPFIICVGSFTALKAQNSVGINTLSPDASAALDVTSSEKGILIPRMTEGERNAIQSPATGLLIYQKDNVPGFYYYSGSQWAAIGGSSAGDSMIPDPSGNAGKVLSNDGNTLTWSDQAASVSLYDRDGNKLGRIISSTISSYQILTSTGYTVMVNIDGAFAASQTFWSSAGCIGSPFINGNSAPIRGEKYLHFSARSGKLYRPSIAQNEVATASTVTYASTEQVSGNCTNASNPSSSAQGYPLTEVSRSDAGLNFTYPFVLPLQIR